jgi:hypothetical protein
MLDRLAFFDDLPVEARNALSRKTEWVSLSIGNLSIFEDDGLSRHIYFPTTAVCALEAVFDGVDVVQLMIFGSNTIVGSAISSSGLRPSLLRTSVIIPGFTGRVWTRDFNNLRDEYPEIDRCLIDVSMRFTWNLAAETSCSNRHAPAQRLAERIAKIDALVGGAPFVATPSRLATWLGCSRTTAHTVFATLKATGAIDIEGQRVLVRNRTALDRIACGCSRQTVETMSAQLSLPIERDENVLPLHR